MSLTPVPPIDIVILQPERGIDVVVVNVPPSPVLVARVQGDYYEFPIRAVDSKRYMPLLEVEARMGNNERLMSLRLERVDSSHRVVLDVDSTLDTRDWRVESVDDHTVRLRKSAMSLDVPLSYVTAVYPTPEEGADWVVALDCKIQEVHGRLRARKFRFSG